MSKLVQNATAKSHWHRSLILVGACLLGWLLVTLVPLVMAQWQVPGTLLGWPSVFAIAAFGVPLVYLTIIGVYCLVMDRLDARAASDDDREAAP